MNLLRRNFFLVTFFTLLQGACSGHLLPGGGEKPPVVFVHGNGDSAALWQSTL